MCGKILYVDDQAENALATLTAGGGLLSGLISSEVKNELVSLINNPMQGSSFAKSVIAQIVHTNDASRSVKAEDVKKIVDTDPRIVYQHNFEDALEYICYHFNEIDLCILDRNLKFFTAGKSPESVRTKCQELGLDFSDNDFNFINPCNNPDKLREGDYLFEVLYEKLGDRVFDRTYFLSAYPENDMRKDRHHAFLLRKFSRAHYISKDDSEKIKQMKSHFEEIMKLKNFEVIQKYFADIFDVLKASDLCEYLDESISYYEDDSKDRGSLPEEDDSKDRGSLPEEDDSKDRGSLPEDYDYNAFFANYRKIIEKICEYITDDNRKRKEPFVKKNKEAVGSVRDTFQTEIQAQIREKFYIIKKCRDEGNDYRFTISIPSAHLDALLQTKGQDDDAKIVFAELLSLKDKYLRTPLAVLDAAYTICCDFLHEQSGNVSLQNQKTDLRQKVTDFFMCKYVYESVKIFFIWLKYFRSNNF